MELLNVIKKILKIGMFNPKNYGFYGEHVFISSNSIITVPENVFLYGNNGLKSAIVMSNSAKFVMKKNSGASHGLRVATADHARIVGIPYRNITEEMKPSGMGKDVIINEDVWIGFNVTLLAGVTIGRGTTIAAGAVVNKSMPPYCVCGGVPAKFIKFYWTIDQIMEHEAKIYSVEERYKKEDLERIFADTL